MSESKDVVDGLRLVRDETDIGHISGISRTEGESL